MRRFKILAVWTAAVVTALPAAALVQPQRGHVLPDYDVRVGGVLKGATVVVGDEDSLSASAGGSPLVTVEPTPEQHAAVARLRASVPGLTAAFQPTTALPRQLHAVGRPLTASSTKDAAAIARDFLKANRDLFLLSDAEVDGLAVVRNYATSTVFRTIWLGQVIDGILVDDGAVRFNIDSQGRIVWVSAGAIQPGLKLARTGAMSSEAAVLAAARHIQVDLTGLVRKSAIGAAQQVFQASPLISDIVVEPAIFPLSRGTAVLAWRVMLEPKNEPAAWYLVTIDARGGRLLSRSNLYKYVTNAGLVFNGNYPNAVPASHTRGVAQTQESFGYRWPSTVGYTIPAPYGQFNLTTGNNVEAKEDLDGNNETTIGAFADGGAMQDFNFVFGNLYAGSASATDVARINDGLPDVSAITTNLFFWINQWHDHMHGLGFDEGSGNFQTDNFSRGGCGRDSIRGDAWDNAQGTPPSMNNANFGTPAESSTCAGSPRPRMQQYVTRFGAEATPSWLADTSLDADVIIHEFSHGTSHRLVGGPFVNCLDLLQSGAMGEGWGDWYAASYFSDPVMGEYSFADPVAGVREYPMNGNPRTYADVCDTGCQVHHDGEVHAATLWDLRQAVGKAVAEQLVTDAMKFAPCSPIFVEFRDALLAADQVRYGGIHTCQIWQAYFDRGMGVDADAIGGALPIADFVFNGPICTGNAHLRYASHTTTDLVGGNGDGLYGMNETIDLNVMLENTMGVSIASGVSATVTTTTPGVTMVTGNRTYPNIAVGGSAAPSAPFQFRIDPTFMCGSKIDFSVQMNWATFSRSEPFVDTAGSAQGVTIFSDGAEGTPLVMGGPAAVSSAQAHTGSNSYYMLAGCYVGDNFSCTAPTGPCSNTCSVVSLPQIPLPSNTSMYLSFWARTNSEVGYDGLTIRASTDGGTTWSHVDTFNYNGNVSGGACGVGDVTGITGPADNSGLTPWTRYEGSLGAYAGQTVLVQIVNTQDVCVEFEGPYVDDIALSVRDCTVAPFYTSYLSSTANNDSINGACSDADGEPDPGETVDVTTQVINTGNSTMNNLSGTLTTTNPNVTIVPATATQSYGNLASGQVGTATYRYTVANTGVPCFDVADFSLALTANGGTFNALHPFSDPVRTDPGSGVWFDDMEGGQAPWVSTLGGAGTVNDFALREMSCFTGTTNRWFWATNFNMNTAGCGSGEPDYSPDSDSVLTSPPIDLGRPNTLIEKLSWRGATAAFITGWGGTMTAGFVDVQIDEDGDGVFTTIESWPNGRNPNVGNSWELDVQNNGQGAPILPANTAQNIQIRFRFRATAADASNGRSADGMVVDDVRLEWKYCDVNVCAPGLQLNSTAGRVRTTSTIPAGPLSQGTPVVGVPTSSGPTVQTGGVDGR